jgi:hypothetical protein
MPCSSKKIRAAVAVMLYLNKKYNYGNFKSN